MEDVFYVYEFERIQPDVWNKKHTLIVESDERVVNADELLVEQELNPKEFMYVKLTRVTRRGSTVIYDINIQ